MEWLLSYLTPGNIMGVLVFLDSLLGAAPNKYCKWPGATLKAMEAVGGAAKKAREYDVKKIF
jgi:hypothetical protein